MKDLMCGIVIHIKQQQQSLLMNIIYLYGTYDFVQRSTTNKDSIYPKQISKKFAVMIENKSINA